MVYLNYIANNRIISNIKLNDDNQKRYGIGNQGFALIIPNIQMSCTIIDGPITADAVKLQSPSSSSSNLYQFWVRREDIKKVLEKDKLKGQRVKFALNGKTSSYKIIQVDARQQFVKCLWKPHEETWIDINNFHTKLSSVALSESSSSSSIINHNENSSNKENEGDNDDDDQDEQDIDINVHEIGNKNGVNIHRSNIRKTRKSLKSHRKSTESKEEGSEDDENPQKGDIEDMDVLMNGMMY